MMTMVILLNIMHDIQFWLSSSMAKFLIDRGIDLESKCEKYSSGKEYLTAKKIYPY